jgi:hypothetical protein
MTQNDLRLVAQAFVQTTKDCGFTVEQLIRYVEQTRRSPELVQAIRKVAKSKKKYD